MIESPLRSWGMPGPFMHRVNEPDLYNTAGFDVLSLLRETGSSSYLTIGNGRSYGDVGLNPGQLAIATRSWDRIVAFDTESGMVTCESGVLLARLIELALPHGWFPAVVPGTRQVTLGGAVANDVHGKNHHVMGSFGDHVLWIELWRSDRGKLRCSRDSDADLFHATIGGLGLTGVILRVGLRLRRVDNGWMQVRTTRFANLDAFFELNARAETEYEYTVAWLDCLPHGGRVGRGVYFAGKHAADVSAGERQYPALPSVRSFPFTPPMSLINGLSLALFNQVYWHRTKEGNRVQPMDPYFFPLDSLCNWNRIYGRKGFFQYQCVMPLEAGTAPIQALLDAIAESGEGSFLAVLKTFGKRAAPGWLSFARPGVTLALDFPHRGESTLVLFSRLNAIVAEVGGALYPAKDALMPAQLFRQAYPRWDALEKIRDPLCSSAFWRRVSES